MYRSIEISYWLTVVLSVFAAGFLTRIFIIFHDCGHGSFFKSRKANDICGFITGVITLTPYYQWRHDHAVHHATSSDLGRRGVGDIWTMTVKEYRASSRLKKLGYRLYRNPLVLFGFGPLYFFFVRNRIPTRSANRRERHSVQWTNLALSGIAIVLSVTIGLTTVAVVQSPIMIISGAAAVWLFYVQHQFDPAYWEQHEDWDYLTAALEGSSFYKLPKILQWFTGNIGFHHVHHLDPRIPNYHLENYHKKTPIFHQIKPITLWSSLKSATLRLWDEEAHRLVGYRHLRTHQRKKTVAG